MISVIEALIENFSKISQRNGLKTDPINVSKVYTPGAKKIIQYLQKIRKLSKSSEDLMQKHIKNLLNLLKEIVALDGLVINVGNGATPNREATLHLDYNKSREKIGEITRKIEGIREANAPTKLVTREPLNVVIILDLLTEVFKIGELNFKIYKHNQLLK